MAEMSVWRARLLTAVKYGIGLAALAWVFSTADVDRTVAAIGRLSGETLVLVVAVSVVGVFARVATWHVLITYFTDVDIRDLLIADLIIKFVNSLFPSRLSGRSIAPIAFHHFTGLALNKAIAVTVAHTGLYAVLYGLLTLLGLTIDFGTYGSGLAVVILLSAIIYLVIGGTVVLVGWRLDVFNYLLVRLTRFVNRFPAGDKITVSLESFRTKLLEGSNEQFQELVRDPQTVCLFGVTWVVAILIVPAVRLWMLLSGTGITTGFDPIFLPLYVVVAYSVTILPLTPGGVGIAEATAVAVFITLGVPEGPIVTVIFLDRLFGVYLPAIVGWAPLVRTNFRAVVE